MSRHASLFTPLYNGQALPLDQAATPAFDDFRDTIIEAVQNGCRLSSLFAMDSDSPSSVDMVAVLTDDANSRLFAARTPLPQRAYPALTPHCSQAHLFEREMAEQFGLHPVNHPWLKPVRFAYSLHGQANHWFDPATRPPQVGVMDYYRVEGEEVHEVGVGPVHAGVIEPGHFRFQCHGENVFHLEISLGYQHRGVEEAALGGPHKITARQMETAAGDTTIGHSWAYHQNLESLSGARVSSRAHVIRAIALELERLANHTGDLGALAGDVGYLPTQSFCGRIRGDLLNMTALICGNRFGRNLLKASGVRFDLTPEISQDLQQRLTDAERDVTQAVNLLWDTPSVMARFENTGSVSLEHCNQLGLVGPAARSCGAERDVRSDHPIGVYQFINIPIAVAHHGDVNSRAFVRWLEVRRSIQFIQERLTALPESPIASESKPLKPNHLAVSLIEGWRGEICHVAVTDGQGRFHRYKITDPSFHNWSGLAMALRNQPISDFPLCNKSFNLSYCGFDL